jgi:hypothetical protein
MWNGVNSGADPGIEVRGGTTLSEVGGLGATLKPLVGPGQSLVGAQGTQIPEAPEFWRFISLKTCLPQSNFTIFLSLQMG